MDFGSSSPSSFDSLSSPLSPPSSPGSSQDNALQEFLLIEQQKAQQQAQIYKLNDLCWEKCVDRAGSKLESKQEKCLSNCVERFFDVTEVVTNRFAQLLQRQQQHAGI